MAAEIRECKRREPQKKQMTHLGAELVRACLHAQTRAMHDGSEARLQDVQRMGKWMEYLRAPGTVNQYAAAFTRVLRWAGSVQVTALPMKPFDMARYLMSLGDACVEKQLTRSSIDAACAAVGFMHGAAGLKSPTENALVRSLKQAMGRRLGSGSKQAAPLTEDIVQGLYKSLGGAGGVWTTQELAFMTRVAVLKDGMLRWDGGARIRYEDVIVTTTHARAFVWENKNDKMRSGFWALLQQNGKQWSAYELLKRLAARFNLEWSGLPDERKARWGAKHAGLVMFVDGKMELRLNRLHVFCDVEQVGEAWLPKGKGEAVSYSKMLRELRVRLGAFGVEAAHKYALHSMRRGKVADMREQGVAEELIREQGGWKSLTTMHVYYDWDTEFTRRVAALRQVSVQWERDALAQKECEGVGLCDGFGGDGGGDVDGAQ